MDGYLLVQIEGGFVDAIAVVIGVTSGVYLVEKTIGPYDVVAKVRGETSQALNAARDDVCSLSGVLAS